MIKRILITIIFVFMCGTAFADSIVLGWGANTEDLDGYSVYMTYTSGSYEFGVDSPNLLVSIECEANDETCCEYTSPQLLWDTTYYWVVTAYNGAGESGPSNEVTHTTRSKPTYPPDSPSGCFIKSVIPSE